jgi:hypothetical protein
VTGTSTGDGTVRWTGTDLFARSDTIRLDLAVMAVPAGAVPVSGVLRWAGNADPGVLQALARGGPITFPALSRFPARPDGDALDDAFARCTAALQTPGDPEPVALHRRSPACPATPATGAPPSEEVPAGEARDVGSPERITTDARGTRPARRRAEGGTARIPALGTPVDQTVVQAAPLRVKAVAAAESPVWLAWKPMFTDAPGSKTALKDALMAGPAPTRASMWRSSRS